METMNEPKFCHICKYVKDWAKNFAHRGDLKTRKTVGIQKLIKISIEDRKDDLHTFLDNE